MINGKSSPFASSPFNVSNSPRLYWQSRDPASPSGLSTENRSPVKPRDYSPSPSKRSSIENLKRASRVKNSNMFAREQKHEYDPASAPVIERPLASGRPLSVQPQENTFSNRGIDGLRKDLSQDSTKTQVYSVAVSPTKEVEDFPPPLSPSKGQVSPAKSSLSNRSRYNSQAQVFDPENGQWSEDEDSIVERQLPPGRVLHRHAKSVTFDAAPPQINEYEMTTPDPSSVASGSRDGSYESADDGEEEESFDRGSSIDRDDSFDASLEDTDKTPVVLPEDWRFMSPGIANNDLAAHMEDPFTGEESSPAPNARPNSATDGRPTTLRTDSTNSNGEPRPLPPLPGLSTSSVQRPRSDSNNTLSATAERVSSVARGSPSPIRPASISKAEIQGMGGCSMSLRERLRLMMLQDEERDETPVEEKFEGALQKEVFTAVTKEQGGDVKSKDIQIYEDKEERDDVAGLGEYKLPPRISRESILRKVKEQSRPMEDMDFSFSSPAPSSSPDRNEVASLDPDVPLPSLEGDSVAPEAESSVFIKEEDDGDSEIDVYSIPDLYSQQAHTYLAQGGHDEKASVSRNSNGTDNFPEEDDASHYSHGSTDNERPSSQAMDAIEDAGPPTPRAPSPRINAQVDSQPKGNHRLSLPQFASMLGDHGLRLGLGDYIDASPPPSHEVSRFEPLPSTSTTEGALQRPMTPEQRLDYHSESEDGPKTPDSVIRHPIERESPLPESPGVPEPVATIKAPGGGLKTRPSATPADLAAMATARRQVSREQPAIPAIPERHRDHSWQNQDLEVKDTHLAGENATRPENDETGAGRQVKRKSSLVQLDFPVDAMDEGLSFGLDREFDRVIEAQKVAFDLPPIYPGASPGFLPCAEYIGTQPFRPQTQAPANRVTRTQKGYLTRQNTKVVVATSNANESVPDTVDTEVPDMRGTRSAGSSPRKASQTPTWTTEPWNSKSRRKSVRQSAGSPQKKPVMGPAPPLPGQQSNVASGLGRVAEDVAPPVTEEIEEGAERGRLFVKVVGVKDLDLPLPRGEIYFVQFINVW